MFTIGADMLNIMKEHNFSSRIIVCSTIFDYGYVRDSLLAGASGFVFKPYSANALIGSVNRAYTENKPLNLETVKRAFIRYQEFPMSQECVDNVIKLAFKDDEVSDEEIDALLNLK